MKQTETNRRIAEALGWSGLEDADALISEMHPWPNSLSMRDLVVATASGWFGWAPGAKGPSSVGGIAQDGADKEPTPDFCGDPSDAALVISECERKEWQWAIGREESCKPGRGWWASIELPSEPGNDDVRLAEESSVSPWHGLGLAFLAAIEAAEAT